MELLGEKSNLWDLNTLRSEEIKVFVEDIIDREPVFEGQKYGVHIVSGDTPESAVARHVELTVFEKYFNNDASVMENEYGPYDKSSVFILVIDHDKKEPAGATRLITHSDAGLKTLNDMTDSSSPWSGRIGIDQRWQEIDRSPECTIDIATMAVMPDYKSQHSSIGVSASMYSACVRWSLQNNVDGWVCIVDQNIFNMMQSWGEPFNMFDSTDWANYLDSPKSLPVYLRVTESLQRIAQYDRDNGTDIHGLYTQGAGLEGYFNLPKF